MQRISGIFRKQEPAKPSTEKNVEKEAESGKKEGKPVAEKIRAGHVHESGCTGCLVALADNYEGLLTILDRYVDWVYDLTLVDTRHIPKMDVVLIEGSVCLQDKIAVDEVKKARENSTIVVAIGSCACTGNINRFDRGGQQNQPQHESYVPISDLIDVDVFVPCCPPTPEQLRNAVLMAYLLLKGNEDQKKLAGRYLQPLMNLAKSPFFSKASFNTLMQEVINQGLCMGCGSCAAACPVRAITMEYGKPQGERDLCINCGACFSQCPRGFFDHGLVEQYEAITELIHEVLK